MGDLRKNISRHEVACKCGCGQAAADTELLDIVQDVRDHFGSPVHFHCVNRCEEHNKQYGKPTSYHPKGMAADFDIKGVEHTEVYAYLVDKYPQKYGIICYSWGIHVDVGQGGNNCNPRPYHLNKQA